MKTTQNFVAVQKKPKEAVYEDEEPYFGEEDTQPKLYDPHDRNFVDFDKSNGFEKSVKKFKGTLALKSLSKNSKVHWNILKIVKILSSMPQFTGSYVLQVRGENNR